MMSQEVDDVLVSGSLPLDVLAFRVPQCSMPAPEADQARITPAYHQDRREAEDFLQAALAAREAAALVKSTLFAAASKPGQPPATGSSSSGKDAETSSMPPPKATYAPEGKATSSGRPASDSAGCWVR